MSPEKKTIVVIGATGNQGSSVARTFLALPDWHVRCVTRNPSSAAAKDLAALGASVVQADLSDIDSLRPAFDGAHSIFLNTDFWGPYRKGTSTGQETIGDSDAALKVEVSHGKNAAIVAASIPTLERFIYSALGPMDKHSKGKYSHCYHWNSKAMIVDYIQNEQPDLAKKTSYIYVGVFNTNPLAIPNSIDPETKCYQFVAPFKKEQAMPMIDPRESTGPFVQALIETEEPGVKLLAYDSLLTVSEISDLWSEVSGRPVDYVEVTVDYMTERFGVPIEVLDAVGYISEYGYMGGVPGSIEPHQLRVKPQTMSFEDWMRKQDLDKILPASDKKN